MRTRNRTLLTSLILLGAGACATDSTAPTAIREPSAGPHLGRNASNGAAFTGVNATEATADPTAQCNNGNSMNAVNCNLYNGTQYVWLNAGPNGGLGTPDIADGVYFFVVLQPGGANNDVNDGQSKLNGKDVYDTQYKLTNKNLSDDVDPYTNRMFRVEGGKIVEFLGTPGDASGQHKTAKLSDGRLIIRLWDYADTPNPGGEYQAAFCRLGAARGSLAYPVDPNQCKYDNFKVKEGGDTPPPKPLQDLKVAKTAEGRYDRTVTWTLDKWVNGSPNKSVAYTGTPGQSFPITWDIKVTKSEAKGNHQVVGAVAVTNPNPVAVDVSIADMLKTGSPGSYADLQSVNVDCDLNTAGSQVTATVPANEAISCGYAASVSADGATLNEATVTVDPASYTVPSGYSGQINGASATAAIAKPWKETLIGDDDGDVTDDLFPTFNQTVTSTGTTTSQLTDAVACSTDPAHYNANGQQVVTKVNTATLAIAPVSLKSSATATVTCNGFKGETATGAGHSWSLTSGGTGNWFMYSPWSPTTFARFALLGGATIALDPLTMGSAAANGAVVQKVPLIAGQQYVVGEVTATVVSGQRKIAVTLKNDARFANVSNNVKIHPLTNCDPTKLTYIQPGQYSIKTLGSALPVNVPSSVSGKPVVCYAVHVDVLRFLAP